MGILLGRIAGHLVCFLRRSSEEYFNEMGGWSARQETLCGDRCWSVQFVPYQLTHGGILAAWHYLIFTNPIRAKLGHDLLVFPGVCALVFNSNGEVLLQRRSDTRKWAVIGRMLDPGEEPADAVVREVREETAIRVIPERISGVYTTPTITYPNGDQAQFIITAFVCKAVEENRR